jgi:transposase
MESTSIYWMPVWRILQPHFSMRLANPYFIKQLPGRKSDVKDAQWIAECLQRELINDSYVPDETLQQMRQYSRRYHYLAKCKVRVEQRMDNNVGQYRILRHSTISF